ncbi:hypothetical protein QN360_17805 [Glaciimonas sp. CA11.2]|uniref:hypothetical protein n=1 Tax=unclassified Glaciimonas TaxID=2644401 RepID=UPI002B23CFC8|nr:MULTISPECIES: hypothetical protein [unclassified Glaciimonas]MEB0164753.1 hypothetical protein [Glaciimonas sp. CA11.2]
MSSTSTSTSSRFSSRFSPHLSADSALTKTKSDQAVSSYMALFTTDFSGGGPCPVGEMPA